MSTKFKQLGLFDELNENIKRVKSLSRTSRRLEAITIDQTKANSGLIGLKASTRLLTEGLTPEDAEFVEVEFKGALKVLSDRLDNKAKSIIKKQAEVM